MSGQERRSHIWNLADRPMMSALWWVIVIMYVNCVFVLYTSACSVYHFSCSSWGQIMSRLSILRTGKTVSSQTEIEHQDKQILMLSGETLEGIRITNKSYIAYLNNLYTLCHEKMYQKLVYFSPTQCCSSLKWLLSKKNMTRICFSLARGSHKIPSKTIWGDGKPVMEETKSHLSAVYSQRCCYPCTEVDRSWSCLREL